jgi:hypothetical protein
MTSSGFEPAKLADRNDLLKDNVGRYSDDRWVGIRFPAEAKYCLFSTASGLDLGSIKCAAGGYIHRGKQ